VNSESDDPLDRVKAVIRADAEALRSRASLPERIANARAAELPSASGGTSIPELARLAGPAFVDNAYRTILGREPDAEGRAQQMAALGAGANKIEILGDLRYSAEGRRRNVAIAGLRPRYLVAKLGRVPLVGAIVQWIIAALSLPHLLRHQRATEASLAVGFGETHHALAIAGQRIAAAEQRLADAEQREEDLRHDLAHAVEELSGRITRTEKGAHEIRVYIESMSASVTELRQLALTMNHWTIEVRKSIDAIEAAEADEEAQRDERDAAAILAARARDGGRAERLAAWADELARRATRGATVLDLGVGSDWLAALGARGFSASAIETNSALHRDAREQKLDVTLGDPAALIARTEDASFDALTVDARAFGARLAHEARRILKPGGVLVVVETHAGRAGVADIAEPAGFGALESLDAPGGGALFAART
jgi:uncharacterized protein DUF4214